jgi:hypothetical protein
MQLREIVNVRFLFSLDFPKVFLRNPGSIKWEVEEFSAYRLLGNAETHKVKVYCRTSLSLSESLRKEMLKVTSSNISDDGIFLRQQS